ncbi:hypothetical protein ID866_2550, partial [Astraeus odoratus]
MMERDLEWELGWRRGYPDLKHIVDRLPANQQERMSARGINIKDFSAGITERQILVEIVSCPNLESLVLTGVPDTSNNTLIELARSIPNLKGLVVNGCKYVTDTGIMELVARAPPLQYLYVGEGVVLTDPAVCAIAKTFTSLRELDLSDGPVITAVSVRDIWMFLRRLSALSLARCPQLTDTAFPYRVKPEGEKPAPEDKPLPHRPTTWIEGLEPLMLRHTSSSMKVLDLSGLTKITDEAIAGVAAHCPGLDTLMLAGCTNLTDKAVESISRIGGLKRLSLAHVHHITDNGVMKLARECTDLRSIDLASVMELAALKKLVRLVLVRVQKLTDNAIYFLADHTPSLERLHLSYCDRITLKSLHHLLRCSHNLDYLTVTGVPAARRRGLGRFSDPPPESWPPDQKAVFRVFSAENVQSL